MLDNLKIKVQYQNGGEDVKVMIDFTDTDGHLVDGTWLTTYGGKINVYWGMPGNHSLQNARLHAEAIDLIVKAAEVIASGKRLEDVWRRDDLEIVEAD